MRITVGCYALGPTLKVNYCCEVKVIFFQFNFVAKRRLGQALDSCDAYFLINYYLIFQLIFLQVLKLHIMNR